MRHFGLLGHPLSHSFSKSFFANKFEKEHIDAVFENFDLSELSGFRRLFLDSKDLVGMNVTIPYKQQVIRYLDRLDESALRIGAVNVIKVIRTEERIELVGYNSDYIGFRDSIQPMLQINHTRALILGTGGASKAVVYALNQLGLETQYVSRTRGEGVLSYEDITPHVLAQYQVVVNCSPVGMYPDLDQKPALPYECVDAGYLFYDLVYNPPLTLFLAEAQKHGAVVKNGQDMLVGQALEAWRIWNE